jgi:hypothetical protein
MSDLWPLRALPENSAELPGGMADFDCGKTPLNVFLRTSTARKLFEADMGSRGRA